MIEIPRLKRRPVRVEGATGQLRAPTTHRLQGGKVSEVDSTHLAHRGGEVVRGGGGEMIFVDVWVGLRL
jgi:hypothetical protein